jgi:hypothetical protein
VKVVLDSSVLIAASISRAGVCAELLEDVLTHHELVESIADIGLPTITTPTSGDESNGPKGTLRKRRKSYRPLKYSWQIG